MKNNHYCSGLLDPAKHGPMRSVKPQAEGVPRCNQWLGAAHALIQQLCPAGQTTPQLLLSFRLSWLCQASEYIF